MNNNYVTRDEFNRVVDELNQRIDKQQEELDKMYVFIRDMMEQQMEMYVEERQRYIGVLVEDYDHKLKIIGENRDVLKDNQIDNGKKNIYM
jgi:hypothetical protein